MPTLTQIELQITPIAAPLGAIVTGLDTSESVAPDVILQLKQALYQRCTCLTENRNR